ncbi:MAG: PKD domain-containing protein [Saprospiraceae bacterium]|nr:PKD domain-containing protein [Saprospiraceae bacterium]
MKRSLFCSLRILSIVTVLLCIYGHVSGQKTIVSAEYFIDTDPGVGSATAITVTPSAMIDEEFFVPLTGIPQGFHMLAVRAKDSDGWWNVATAKLFYINPNNIPIPPVENFNNVLVDAEYFFDTDPGEGNGIPTQIPVGTNIEIQRSFATGSLMAGAHKVGVRVRQLNGQWSSTFGINFTVTTPVCSLPSADFSFTMVNAGQSVTLTNLSSNLSVTPTYEWDILANGSVEYMTENASHTFNSAGLYDIRLRVINEPGCTTSVVKQVEVGPIYSRLITLDGPASFCEGDTVLLTAPAGSGWVWQDGYSLQEREVTTSGHFQVSYTDQNNNTALSDLIYINMYPALDIVKDSTPDFNSQNLGSAAIFASGGSSNIYSFQWSNAATTYLLTGLSAGNYLVTVSDGVCPDTISITVPNISNLGDDLVAVEYFIGYTDPGPGNGTPLLPSLAGEEVSSYWDIPVSALSFGPNRLNVRVKRASGFWGMPTSLLIYKPDIPEPLQAGNIKKMEYFFDTDPGPGKAFPLTVAPPVSNVDDDYLIDFAGLTPGLHKLTVRAANELNEWGIEKTISVLIDNPLPPIDINEYPLVSGEYFFNSDPGEGKGNSFSMNPAQSINIKRLAELAMLNPGNHKVGIRVKDLSGAWSTSQYVNFTVTTPSCTLPIADFTYTQANAGAEMLFTAQNTGTEVGTTYVWDVMANGTTDYITENMAHTFSTPGVYDVLYKADNGSGCFNMKLKQVIVGPLLDNTIQLNGPSEFCSGGSVTLTAPAGTGFLWSSGQTTQSIAVNNSGTFEVSYVDLNGTNRVSESVQIVVRPSLITSLTISPANNSEANGSANVAVQGGSTFTYNYNWSGGQTTSAITNVAPNTYMLTISDPYCPAILNIEIPNLTGIPQGIIAAEFFTMADPGPGNGTAILISKDAEINSYFSLDMTGYVAGVHNLYIRVRSSNGFWSMPGKLTVVITDLSTVPQHKPDIVAAQYFFNSDPGIASSFPLSGITSDTMINDNPEFSFAGLDPGLHRLFVRVKNDEGNWSQAIPIDVLVDFMLPSPDINEYPIVWAEIFFGTDPGVGKGMGRAIPPGMSVNILRDFQLNALSPGTYTAYLRVKTLNHQWSMPQGFTFSIFQTEDCTQPVPDFTYVNADAGMPMQFTNSSTALSAEPSYQWDILSDGTVEYTTDNASHTFPAAGLYQVRLRVANSFLCYKSIIKEVEVGPYQNNALTLSGSTFLCGGDSLIITAPIGTNYVWSTGATTQSITVKTAGNYQVLYTDGNGNSRASEEVSVQVNPEILVTASASPANDGDNNGSANVFVSGGNTYFYNYNWSNGSNQAMQTGLLPGVYTVTVSDLSCDKILNINIADLINSTDGIVAAEYFLGNTDPGPGNGLPIIITKANEINSFFTLNLGVLTPGIYNMYVRVKRANGFWSVVKPLLISVSDYTPLPPYIRPNIVSLEYFFGTTDPGETMGIGWNSFSPDTTISVQVPVSVASQGFGPKSIYLRFKDSEGQYSIVKGGTFQICDQPTSPTVSDDIVACQGNTVMLTSSSNLPGITYYWEGPDGFSSTQQNVTISNVGIPNAGLYKAFAVVDGNCYSMGSEVELSVGLLPTLPGDILTTATECKEATVFFVPFINNATNYEWTFPNGITIFAGNNTNNIAVTFDGYIGSFDLQVRGSNACGTTIYSTPLNVNTCFCRDVKNVNDGGLSSLRNAIGCANPVDTIQFDNQVIGQTINISSGALTINKNIVIRPNDDNDLTGNGELFRGVFNNDRVIISNNTSGPVFNVLNGSSLILNQVDLYVGEDENAHGIITSGILILNDTHIYQKPGAVGTALTANPGADVSILGSTKVLIEE